MCRVQSRRTVHVHGGGRGFGRTVPVLLSGPEGEPRAAYCGRGAVADAEVGEDAWCEVGIQ